ncbi:MAG: hypothetical protein IJD77_00970 [Clostridia bacterium]|nr:hypothetical protein [Clostridia bacterium]
MAREKHVNATTEEAKAAIIENSVLGESVPINPVGNATELKQRFVNPIVNDKGNASAIAEVDRVAAETEAALDEIDENLVAVAKSVSEIGGELEEIDEDVTKLQEDVQDLCKNKVNKSGDTMNGPLTVESQSGPGKTEVSEQGVFVTNDGENGTAYDDGVIVNQGKRIVIPLKDGTMALEENTITSIGLWMGVENYQLNLVGYSGTRPVVHDIIDLPLESMVVGGEYNGETKQIELTLQNGNVVSFPVDELVNGLISSSEKGAPNGVASLDAEGKVPKEQLPDGIGGAANMEEGTGKGAVQQVADGVAGGIDFTGKNPNATALDSTLTGVIPYGATGNYSSAFGGKSIAKGKRSHAEGTTTIALGAYSHAEGDNSVSFGADSHAEGYQTVSEGTGSHSEGTGTIAKGAYSHAEGIRTIAEKDGAHAEGCDTTASGEHSHAEGNSTNAIGTYSHAEGFDTTAEGLYAHSEGSESAAIGNASHAEGFTTSAGGAHSHAEGYETIALGDHSHVEGMNSKAIGAASHAEGGNNIAEGDYSHAGGIDSKVTGWGGFVHGQELKSSGTAQTVVGRFNSNDGDALFEVGNGTSTEARSTAFKVMGDGRAKVQGEPKDKDDVVRLMDHGTNEKAGVLRGVAAFGFKIDAYGRGAIVKAEKAEIEAKTNEYKPIVPANQDHAWKASATTNTETFTDEEKAAACETIGAVAKAKSLNSQPAQSRVLYGAQYTNGVPTEKQFSISLVPTANCIPMYDGNRCLLGDSSSALEWSNYDVNDRLVNIKLLKNSLSKEHWRPTNCSSEISYSVLDTDGRQWKVYATRYINQVTDKYKTVYELVSTNAITASADPVAISLLGTKYTIGAKYRAATIAYNQFEEDLSKWYFTLDGFTWDESSDIGSEVFLLPFRGSGGFEVKFMTWTEAPASEITLKTIRAFVTAYEK